MIDERILLIITSELTDQAEREELDILRDWLAESNENRILYHKYKDAFINGKYLPKGKNQDKIFDKLSDRLHFGKANDHSNGVTSEVPRKNSFHAMYKYAAVLVFFILSAFIIFRYSDFWRTNTEQVTQNDLVVKTNPRGIKSLITLPDGTRVKLNSESSIEYYSDFANDRRVKLVGEAFFEVVKDTLHPFYVKSGDLTVKVLGTSFNVKAFPFEQMINIALVSGKVAVEAQTEEGSSMRKYLKPDEMFSYNIRTSDIQISNFDYDLAIGWKDGALNFREEGFTTVVKMLERWYGVSIIIEQGTDMSGKYTGYYKNETLESVLEGLSFAYEFDYRIEGKNVIIK